MAQNDRANGSYESEYTSSGTDFIKIGTVYINRNAITHFEVLTENEENDEDTDLSQWDFLSGDYSKY